MYVWLHVHVICLAYFVSLGRIEEPWRGSLWIMTGCATLILYVPWQAVQKLPGVLYITLVSVLVLSRGPRMQISPLAQGLLPHYAGMHVHDCTLYVLPQSIHPRQTLAQRWFKRVIGIKAVAWINPAMVPPAATRTHPDSTSCRLYALRSNEIQPIVLLKDIWPCFSSG